MMSRFRGGYSLIELLVVMGILVMLGTTSLPNLYGRSDREDLEQSARELRQLLLDARIRSLAPSKNDSPGQAQFFQVTFGPLSSEGQGSYIGAGNESVSTFTLEKGLTNCNDSESAAGVPVKSLKMPRNVHVSTYFPTQYQQTGLATIRFNAGITGFQCGLISNKRLIDAYEVTPSLTLRDDYWVGVGPGGTQVRLANLYVELKSKSSGESRFVTMNRFTTNISVTKIKPDQTFQPLGDNQAPMWYDRWKDTVPLTPATGPAIWDPNPPPDPTITVSNCTDRESTVEISFTRAVDLFNGQFDQNRAVYYDIDWALPVAAVEPPAGSYQPLAIGYSEDPKRKVVKYRFNTMQVSNSVQPPKLWFKILTSDFGGNAPKTTQGQDDYYKFSFDRDKWSCSSSKSGTGSKTIPGQAGSQSEYSQFGQQAY